jgi:hypothetical protein
MGEAVLFSYGLCGIRATALTQQHFETSRMASNMLLGRWSADGVQLWQVDLQCVQLQQGCSTYQVPSNTITILDAYIGYSNGSSDTDRLILPISRTEYASYANKKQQGSVTTFWFDRLLQPTITLWPVPSSAQYVLKYYRLRQSQDANLSNGGNVEIPYYYTEAFCFGLAYRLALTWAPEKVPMLKPLADEAWAIASKQNTENASYYFSPMIAGYYR